METIDRGEDRVNIDEYDPDNTYSSYIVRRDRYSKYDIMLNTYGRENGFVEGRDGQEKDGWIGLKYPSASKVTDETIKYIENDFSNIEKVIYSEDEKVFRNYKNYIDVDSFVDYFLLNEFMGNYDAGTHSTFMYKNSGDVLSIGPVWDFDQALDNNKTQESETDTLAFQTEPLFKELCQDKQFVRKLRSRYTKLRRNILSEENVYDLIDEAAAYLKSAQKREWYRWADEYTVETESHYNLYILSPYVSDGFRLNRLNDDYGQELVVIKYYLHKHGAAIAKELEGVYNKAEIDTASSGVRPLLFLMVIALFLVPSYLIMRRD